MTDARLKRLARLSREFNAALAAMEATEAIIDGYVNVKGMAAADDRFARAEAAWESAIRVHGHELIAEVRRLRQAAR